MSIARFFRPSPSCSGFRVLPAATALLQLFVSVASSVEPKGADAARPRSATADVPRKTSPTPKQAPSPGQPPSPSGNTSVTTITAQKRLLLDSQGREATFWGDVKVVDARFSLACEKLTVFFRNTPVVSDKLEGDDAREGKDGKRPVEAPGNGSLERAVAEGDVVIFQEKTNDLGEIERSVGRAQKAVYDTKTGNIALSGWPQVEQKQNTIVAMEESTVILLNQKGTLEVLGHSKSVLRSGRGENVR
jgi:lipopolysaccharide export system protein LptA